ncbi:hypothetical protein HaLaN_23192, partial [Haematococcus lacustris]
CPHTGHLVPSYPAHLRRGHSIPDLELSACYRFRHCADRVEQRSTPGVRTLQDGLHCELRSHMSCLTFLLPIQDEFGVCAGTRCAVLSHPTLAAGWHHFVQNPDQTWYLDGEEIKTIIVAPHMANVEARAHTRASSAPAEARAAVSSIALEPAQAALLYAAGPHACNPSDKAPDAASQAVADLCSAQLPLTPLHSLEGRARPAHCPAGDAGRQHWPLRQGAAAPVQGAPYVRGDRALHQQPPGRRCAAQGRASAEGMQPRWGRDMTGRLPALQADLAYTCQQTPACKQTPAC